MSFSLIKIITYCFGYGFTHRIMEICRSGYIFNRPGIIIDTIKIYRTDLYIDRCSFHYCCSTVSFYIVKFIQFISRFRYRPLKFFQISLYNQRITRFRCFEFTIVEASIIGVCNIISIIFNRIKDRIFVGEINIV